MLVMVTDMDTSEDKMAELEKKINMLMKAIEERDYEITSLKNHIESRDAAESSHSHIVKNVDKVKAIMQESQLQNSTSIASIMSNGYQPPKFQQFNGKHNIKQHVAHFIETCATTSTQGDLLRQLERDFLNRFYSTRHIVNMMELINTRQRKGEPVIDYINRWRALSLDYKDRLIELSTVEMCTQGMHWEFLYILQGIKLRTFEELATRTHDMVLSIANMGAKDFLVQKM
ncbi:ty3-gypsy retrotransposon protein [Cucumis melo var. makuwa]|uniref:Ty3-gypsy retrotransposon protein n=1 Tax=Cucumis melo var. makuwa TaxID=1194695 RepID=A0A5D3DSY8_CUCMM|nr:ty3-gypsy retrotransposon protein [Cucumis melo var. makuwa]